MDFDEVVRKRKMTRVYNEGRQIPNELVSRLIKNAHIAPSAGRTQVQEFIIVKDNATKKKLRKADVNQEYVEKAPVLIVVCSNSLTRWGGMAIAERNFIA